MTYAIVGFGAVGQALAKAFARADLAVTVAGRRPPHDLEPIAATIGSLVQPATLRDAVLAADVVILAMPFGQHDAVGHTLSDWSGKLVIDATNALGTPLDRFGGLTSSAFAARSYPGARFAKGFNHLPAAKLAADPKERGGHRVIFTAADDDDAGARAGAVIGRLGYAPVFLGTLAEGGVLTQARGDRWSPLTFQDLTRFD